MIAWQVTTARQLIGIKNETGVSTFLSNWLLHSHGILFQKLFWPTVRKKCSSDREKLLKFEAEGR